jgi:hypothetical protein
LDEDEEDEEDEGEGSKNKKLAKRNPPSLCSQPPFWDTRGVQSQNK